MKIGKSGNWRIEHPPIKLTRGLWHCRPLSTHGGHRRLVPGHIHQGLASAPQSPTIRLRANHHHERKRSPFRREWLTGAHGDLHAYETFWASREGSQDDVYLFLRLLHHLLSSGGGGVRGGPHAVADIAEEAALAAVVFRAVLHRMLCQSGKPHYYKLEIVNKISVFVSFLQQKWCKNNTKNEIDCSFLNKTAYWKFLSRGRWRT